MNKIIAIAIVLTTTHLIGCAGGTAQLVQRHADGGRVKLTGAYMPAMGEARMVMLEHCEGRFDYLEQGETVAFECRVPAAPTGLATPATIAVR